VALADITRQAVLKAVAADDELGQDQFLGKHDFDRARRCNAFALRAGRSRRSVVVSADGLSKDVVLIPSLRLASPPGAALALANRLITSLDAYHDVPASRDLFANQLVQVVARHPPPFPQARASPVQRTDR
jgi:hypothetical protein